MLAARSDDDLDQLASTTLYRFQTLTVTTAGAIREAGLELRPTFRRPHYTVMLPDLEADLDRLASCQNEERINPYFARREAD